MYKLTKRREAKPLMILEQAYESFTSHGRIVHVLGFELRDYL